MALNERAHAMVTNGTLLANYTQCCSVRAEGPGNFSGVCAARSSNPFVRNVSKPTHIYQDFIRFAKIGLLRFAKILNRIPKIPVKT